MTQYELAREHLTAWIRDYGEAKSPEFIADLNAVLRECERLREIVALLPKDAEGNPLAVGMRRWVSDEDSNGPFQRWETITQLHKFPIGEWEVSCVTCDTSPECCWSSENVR